MKAMRAARASSDRSRSLKCSASTLMRASNGAAFSQHQVAGDLQRLWRLGGNQPRRLEHLGLQILLADHGVDQAGFLRTLGGKPLAESQQRKRLLASDDGGHEQAGAGFRHQAEIGEGRVEDRARRGEGQVAMQVERRADADRDAVDAGNHRLGGPGERGKKIPDFFAALAANGHRHEIGKVVARRKGAGHAEEDMRRARRHRRRQRPSAADIVAYMARVMAFFLSGRFMRMI